MGWGRVRGGLVWGEEGVVMVGGAGGWARGVGWALVVGVGGGWVGVMVVMVK